MSLLFYVYAYGKFDAPSSLLIVCPYKYHYDEPNVMGSKESTVSSIYFDLVHPKGM
jgi:hypothetical protein